ncbi:MAG: hypothetical protein QME05_03350, partial [Candidatus Margulisbacteria bacterium]|nr:hypothetical protein [Candidatus Margulisiibacteriota bacterium]
MTAVSITRPTLAGNIFPAMQTATTPATPVGSDKLTTDEDVIADQVLQAMIAKTNELFSTDGKGPVDQAGAGILRKAVSDKKISGERAQAIWNALFTDPNNILSQVEAALMTSACLSHTRPTLAGNIFPTMQTATTTATPVGSDKLTTDEDIIVDQMLQAMIA